MTTPLRGLCSKATAAVLAELAGLVGGDPGLRFEAAGGAEVARRVRAREVADLLVLADDVVDALRADGLVVGATVRPLLVSEVVLGVRDDRPTPPLETVADLAELLRGAIGVGYSTGPSGRALTRWLTDAGLEPEVGPRLVEAEPGVPVARLLAEGRAEVGIQQYSEMAGVPGIRVVGPLPGAAAATSTFTGAVLTSSDRPQEAARVLALLGGSPEARGVVEAGGLRLADGS